MSPVEPIASAPRAAAPPRVRWVRNGEPVALADLPDVRGDDLAETCAELCARGGRLSALALLPARDGQPRALLAVLADDANARLGLMRAQLDARGGYPALTRLLPQAQAFEREIFEQSGIRPEGHPWLKPLRLHAGLAAGAGAGAGAGARAGAAAEVAVPPHPFFRVEGPGIHEVAVGPVHATPTKPGRRPVGAGLLAEVVALDPPRPWFAIGGIDLGNLDEVLAAGATRVVVVRAIADAPDPAEATAALATRLRKTASAGQRPGPSGA